MSRTWKSISSHQRKGGNRYWGVVGDYRGKGIEYVYNYRSNSHVKALRESKEPEDGYPPFRKKSIPPSPYEDQKAHGRIKPIGSRFTEGRSQKQLKEIRIQYENDLEKSQKRIP